MIMNAFGEIDRRVGRREVSGRGSCEGRVMIIFSDGERERKNRVVIEFSELGVHNDLFFCLFIHSFIICETYKGLLGIFKIKFYFIFLFTYCFFFYYS